jgi:hypothetical protein
MTQQSYKLRQQEPVPDKAFQREELQKQMEGVLRKTRLDEDLLERHEHRVTDIDQQPLDGLAEPLGQRETKDHEIEEARVIPGISELAQHLVTPLRKLTLTMAEIKHIYTEAVEKQEEEDEEHLTLREKIMKYVTLPVEVITMVCISNVDTDELDKWYSPLVPFTGCMAFLTLTRSRPD